MYRHRSNENQAVSPGRVPLTCHHKRPNPKKSNSINWVQLQPKFPPSMVGSIHHHMNGYRKLCLKNIWDPKQDVKKSLNKWSWSSKNTRITGRPRDLKAASYVLTFYPSWRKHLPNNFYNMWSLLWGTLFAHKSENLSFIHCISHGLTPW